MARQEQRSSSATLPKPLRNAASALRKVPGAGLVSRAAEEALDKVAVVSPRGRRLAVYAGAGVLGVVGIVEWPVAVTGAAVAWLTQPRPEEPEPSGDAAGAGGEFEIPTAEEEAGTPADAQPTTRDAVPQAPAEETAPTGRTVPAPGGEAAPAGPVAAPGGETVPAGEEPAAPVVAGPFEPVTEQGGAPTPTPADDSAG